jgi:hypothetical protein
LCFFFLLKVPFSVMSMSFDASSIRSWASSTFSRRWCWNIVGIIKLKNALKYYIIFFRTSKLF